MFLIVFDTVFKLFPFLFVTIGFGIVGFIDDYIKLVLKNSKGLKPSYKMIGLLIVSVAYSIILTKVLNIGTDTYIPFLISLRNHISP